MLAFEFMNLSRNQTLKIVVACKKLIKEHGVFKFTFSQLSQESGISTGVLHRNIKSKDDLMILNFITVVDSHIKLVEDLIESDLNHQEQFICHISYPAFFGSLYESHGGVNFLGANPGLIKNAQPEFIELLAGAFSELSLVNNRVFNEIFPVNSSDRNLTHKALRHAFFISRGAAVASCNRFISKNTTSIDLVMEIVHDVIKPLEWPQGHTEVSYKKIKNYMRNISDLGLTVVI
ncbi:TetR/AcrR family transcriptional regulator [Ferrimonas lipolytica]|uniref:TetR/AcrR family transcriptional regulator n=1 Tax=Ferrimonas lipolytica TaxID=2724191 RepID=A0A6H1U9Q4_9GAMM|nr:TetR/AcrR family transcriptional regulator [Ferrimonas lipolytica]QIZ75777.1 TetR/AcrR family transcriptional regulator [Ferrimonas lipolytica]